MLAHFYPQAGAGFAGVVPVAFVRPVVRVRPCLEVGAEVVHGEADVRFQRLQFTAGIVQDFHPREVAEHVGLSARQLEVVAGVAQHGEQFGEWVVTVSGSLFMAALPVVFGSQVWRCGFGLGVFALAFTTWGVLFGKAARL